MKQFELDRGDAREALRRPWEHSVGSGHATTALRSDWQEMMKRSHDELGFRYVRFHGLFNDDMYVAYRQILSSEIILSFTNVDKIFDFLLSIDMKPFIELSFMPTCFSSGSSTTCMYKGNTTPPADYEQWAWFIGEFVEHLLSRYGRDEVRHWFFEVWNEPNLGGPNAPVGFWAATMQEYFKFYKVTAEAIKQQDPALKVGGPSSSNNAWLPGMIAFCKESGTPLDFVSTHHYPSDLVLGLGVEGDASTTGLPFDLSDPAALAEAFALPEKMAEFTQQYKELQKNLWKQVDRGVLLEMTKKSAEQAGDIPLYYTEWSSLAGLPSDGPFGASFIAKTALEVRNLVETYSYWTFCDIFEENGQKSTPFHGGYGLLTIHNIAKAPYRAFQLLHRLGSEIYQKTMTDGTVDVFAVAKPESSALQLLVVNHNSLLHSIEEETVRMELSGFGTVVAAEVTRVDENHANALAAWQGAGAPEYPDEVSLLHMEAASCLKSEPLTVETAGDGLAVELTVPPMGIALVTVYLKSI